MLRAEREVGRQEVTKDRGESGGAVKREGNALEREKEGELEKRRESEGEQLKAVRAL